MKVSELKPLEKNPFKLKGDAELELIGQSIESFKKMMTIRKIVIDENNEILGGNKRFWALKKLGYKIIPDEWIDKRTDLSEAEKREFIVKDNSHWGSSWDYEMLKEWEVPLMEWGVPENPFNEEIGDVVELDKITTTFNINIKCDSPDELEQLKFKLGITSNSIHSSMLVGLLA